MTKNGIFEAVFLHFFKIIKNVKKKEKTCFWGRFEGSKRPYRNNGGQNQKIILGSCKPYMSQSIRFFSWRLYVHASYCKHEKQNLRFERQFSMVKIWKNCFFLPFLQHFVRSVQAQILALVDGILAWLLVRWVEQTLSF